MSESNTPKKQPHGNEMPDTPAFRRRPYGQEGYPEHALRNNMDYTLHGNTAEIAAINDAIIRHNGDIRQVLIERYGGHDPMIPVTPSSPLGVRIQTVLAQHSAEQKAQKEKEAKGKKPKTKQTKMDKYLKKKGPDPDGNGGAGAGATGVFGGRKSKRKRKRKRKTKRFRKKKKTKRRKSKKFRKRRKSRRRKTLKRRRK